MKCWVAVLFWLAVTGFCVSAQAAEPPAPAPHNRAEAVKIIAGLRKVVAD